jgi:hypothetical protein
VGDGKQRHRPTWVAIGFLAAFAASVLTVVLTGLYVRAPGSAPAAAELPAAPGSSAEKERAPEPEARDDADAAQ